MTARPGSGPLAVGDSAADPGAAGRFRLRLLGYPAVAEADGSPLVGLGPGKPLALLIYLAVRNEARREELVDLLWGDATESNARNAFRQALHRLRTALGEDLLPPDRERVTLADSSSLWVDRDDFIVAVEAGDTARAVELYRGDFLDGFDLGEPVFDSWADAERVRLRSRFQVALHGGAEAALNAGRWIEALQYVQRLTIVAPFDHAAALLEANVLVAAGRSAEAVASLRRFSDLMKRELDVDAPAPVRELLARIERSETRAQRATPSASDSPQLPLVGREEEIGRLLAAARELASEQGMAVVVAGEAGIGKSRLLAEFLLRARSLGPLLVLRGRERPLAAALPYASIAEAMRALVRAPGIAGTGRHLMVEASRILPELRDHFELPEPGPVDADGGRLRFFEGVASLIESAAYERPVCLILDDMHNASASTIDMLSYLCGRLQASPVLIVIAFRSDGDETLSGRIRGLATSPDDSPPAVLTLSPLSLDDTGRLIAAVLSAANAGGQVDVGPLAAAAAGNPFRAIDLARRALNGELPSSSAVRFRDILWDRLQKCSPSQRRLFFAAALIQRRVPLRILASAAHLTESTAFEAVQALEAAELLEQEEHGYVLAHDFTTAFVGEMSGPAGRSLLAGWAADALDAESAASAAELAHLYSIAGRHALAFGHARRAAYDAAAAHAPLEVHRLLSFALALAPDDASRAGIESLLAAFGSGRPLLAAPADDAAPPPGSSVTGRASEGWPARLDAPAAGSPVRVASPRNSLAAPDAAQAVDPAAATADPALLVQEPAAETRGAPPTIPFDPVAGGGGHRSPRAEMGAARPAPRESSSGAGASRGRSRVRGLLLGACLLLVAAAGWRWQQSRTLVAPRFALQDSLVVSTRGTGSSAALSAVTGPVDDGPVPLVAVAPPAMPVWLGQVSRPWLNARPSPDGSIVAIEQMTGAGTDVYLMLGDPSRRIPVAIGGGFDSTLAWSPDGRSLLVRRARTLEDGAFDSDLWVYAIDRADRLTAVPVDTAPDRSIREAAWSPDGRRIAWVAQVGESRQQDVFLARADGAGARNLSEHPADDYHISWSRDGSLLAFTTDRAGNPDLYAFDLAEGLRLWPLATTPAPEDHAAFSPDGRYVAFQSTRDSEAGVYLMPALGGAVTRVTPAGGQYSIVGWRSRTPSPYVDRLRLIGRTTMNVGDSSALSVLAVDSRGGPLAIDSVMVQSLDRDVADVAVSAAGSGKPTYTVRARGQGVARVVASIPGWRNDTVRVHVGNGTASEVLYLFERGISGDAWRTLGQPRPSVGRGEAGAMAIFLDGDLQWQSGLLSRSSVTLAEGTVVSARVTAPFHGRAVPAAQIQLALVADPADSVDVEAPRFAALASILWDGEAGRMIYSVGSESRSEPVTAIRPAPSHTLRMSVIDGGLVRFEVDGVERWTASLRLLGATEELQGKLWIGGRATDRAMSVRDVLVRQP